MKRQKPKAKPRPKKKATTTGTKSAARLTIPELAALLSKALDRTITTHMIEEAIAIGAPMNLDGTLNLFEVAAWLEQKRTR